jgi:penicillin-binding protein 1A
MRAISQLIRVLGAWLVRKEWHAIRGDLARIRFLQSHEIRYAPTLLAQRYLILGEDHRFFSHGGVDPIAICRAAWRGVVLRRPEGASTIEMQVVRVISGRYERTIRRKLREMILATLVSQEVPKDALPSLYLRIGYYGSHMNGLAEAYRRLGLSSENLTPMVTARLVARLKYPEPREANPRRRSQIDMRAHHLLRLDHAYRSSQDYGSLITESEHASI